MQRSSGTGTPREQLVNTHFPDYVTEPEQTRNGYQQVLARGVVTDCLLTNRRLTEFQAKMSSWASASCSLNVTERFAARGVTR